MKNEISKKNPYWIPKYRYLELKNWVKQYPIWAERKIDLLKLRSNSNYGTKVDISELNDPTVDTVIDIEKACKSIDLVDTLIHEICPECEYAFRKSLIDGHSYDWYECWIGVSAVSRAEWYKRRRAFFYWLDKRRD